MSKNTIIWPGVMHVDAKGNVTHKDLKITFDPKLLAFSCEWPKYLEDQMVGNGYSPADMVDYFERAGERYQKKLLLANSSTKLAVFCGTRQDSDDGEEHIKLSLSVVKATLLSDGTPYLLYGDGSMNPMPSDYFLVDDTPEVRERLTQIGQSIGLAGALLYTCGQAPDPTAALMDIRFGSEDPAARTSQKLVNPNPKEPPANPETWTTVADGGKVLRKGVPWAEASKDLFDQSNDDEEL